ncbi:hypothetical protein [Agrobacterium rosae]|uniref:Uncharacterized protein n=1 Tax=Agrobacterium rosae TaxID=1972867 RepID=A0AAW9FLB5_9HYPH|nr:hypothetical protein [Agrobacterium rosae]MDX8304387.1 hypothetical protein [Agrobacterium rosae]
MNFQKLDEHDVAALARASGLNVTPERVATLVATLPIVNPIRETLWARSRHPTSEPSHIFTPAKGEGAQ